MLEGNTNEQGHTYVVYQYKDSFVAMGEAHYNHWAKGVNKKVQAQYPVVARGLTQEVAEAMEKLSQGEN